VIGVDTNVLVHTHPRDSEWHRPAARWVADLATAAWLESPSLVLLTDGTLKTQNPLV
jgi:predicted nucleic acid-binding protein